MERRDRSLEALNTLKYIDSLDANLRADSIVRWIKKYLTNNKIEDFILDINESKNLLELFYKNILFLKQHQIKIRAELKNYHKIKEFLQ